MPRKIIAIGAHPDDIEFGCGGALAKHVDSGDIVTYICMTNSESIDGTTGKVLRSRFQLQNEINNAATVMGIHDVRRLDFKDLHIPFNFDSVSCIEKIIKEISPDVVYTHWAGDANQDHVATHQITMAAARYVKNVFCYEQIPILRLYENQMTINYYVDITDQMTIKLDASNCHCSQIEKYYNSGFNVLHNLRILAEFRGIQSGCKYAEGFHVIKTVN